jgi:HD-like signal output (HDOD) protein
MANPWNHGLDGPVSIPRSLTIGPMNFKADDAPTIAGHRVPNRLTGGDPGDRKSPPATSVGGVIDTSSLFGDSCVLPPLPEVVMKIERLKNDPNAGMEEIAELVRAEPALLAQVLKIANSAYYGLPRKVSDARFAAAFLGLDEISRLVLSLSVINTLGVRDKEELSHFWAHSFYTAVCTKYLARKYDPLLALEELWSASMLHDIGKLVYLKFFPEQYLALRTHCDSEQCLFSEAEQALDLPASSGLGALLSIHWALPDSVRNACLIHTLGDLHRGQQWVDQHPISRMVCLGNLFAVLTTDPLSEPRKQAISDAIQTELKQTGDEFLLMTGEMYELRQEVDKFVQGLLA